MCVLSQEAQGGAIKRGFQHSVIDIVRHNITKQRAGQTPDVRNKSFNPLQAI